MGKKRSRSPRRKKKRNAQPDDNEEPDLSSVALEQVNLITQPLLDSVVQGPLDSALHCSGTVLPLVLRSAEFWLLCGLHVLLRVLHSRGKLSGSDEFASWEDVKVFTVLVIAFLAVHLDNCCSRHAEVKSATVALFGSVYDLVFRLRLHFGPGKSQEHMLVALRWVTASLLASLQSVVSGREPGKAEWRKLMALGLLRQSEVIFFSTLTSQQRPLILLHATGDLLRIGLLQAKAPEGACADVTANLLQHLSLQSEISDFESEGDLPSYRQVLGVMVLVLLLAWAYIMAVTETVVASVAYPFLALLLLGVVQLSACLAQPFSSGSAGGLQVAEWTAQFSQCLTALLSCDLAANAEEHRNLSHMNCDVADQLLGSEPVAATESDEADSAEPLLVKDVLARSLEEGYANSSAALHQLDCSRKKVHKHKNRQSPEIQSSARPKQKALSHGAGS